MTEQDGKDAPRAKARKPSKRSRKSKKATERLTLQEALQIQEDGTQAHRRSENTRVTYDGHVDRVKKWFVEHLQVDIDAMAVGTTVLNDSPLPGDKEIEEMRNDPEFLNALERPPNKWSGVVAGLYLSWLVFKRQLTQSTVEGAHAALLRYWDEA